MCCGFFYQHSGYYFYRAVGTLFMQFPKGYLPHCWHLMVFVYLSFCYCGKKTATETNMFSFTLPWYIHIPMLFCVSHQYVYPKLIFSLLPTAHMLLVLHVITVGSCWVYLSNVWSFYNFVLQRTALCLI